mgnify:CR=1 FL=1
MLSDLDLPALRARGAQLIDAREGKRYRGEMEPIDPIAGHIPGALNVNWQSLTDDSGQRRGSEELAQIWDDIESEAETVVYCGSGVTACVNALALELAGRRRPLLYPGSWSDWCSRMAPEDS